MFAPAWLVVLAAAPWSATKPLPTPVLFLEGLVSTGHDDAHVSFSPDGRDLYFLRDSPDFQHYTVLHARWTGSRYAEPEVASFSGRYNDGDVAFSPDGGQLYFVSNRPTVDAPDAGPRPDTELWTIDLTRPHPTPHHLDELSSPGDEWFPTVTASGTLYFGSERDGGFGGCDLWRAKPEGDHFAPPENLGPVVNGKSDEIEPFIDPLERYLIFSARNRTPSAGAYDLYVSFRCDDRWTEPQPLGAGVNSAGWDFGPRVSPDGKYLFFTSNRSTVSFDPGHPLRLKDLNAQLSRPGNGLRDVYQVDFAALQLKSPCAPPLKSP